MDCVCGVGVDEYYCKEGILRGVWGMYCDEGILRVWEWGGGGPK